MSDGHSRGFVIGETGTGVEPPVEVRVRDEDREAASIDFTSLSFGNWAMSSVSGSIARGLMTFIGPPIGVTNSYLQSRVV